MQVDEYAAHDATGLAELIKAGKVTAAEVHAAALDALRAVLPRLGAGASEPFDVPLDHDESGRFGGVPFALKDLVCHAAGVPTRMGSRLTGPHGLTFPHDTELMSRFRKAGLATTILSTSPEMGYNANTEPLIHGSTCSPVGCHPVGRRVEWGICCARRGRGRTGRTCQRRRRLDPHPRRLQRVGRAEADPWPGPDRPRLPGGPLRVRLRVRRHQDGAGRGSPARRG